MFLLLLILSIISPLALGAFPVIDNFPCDLGEIADTGCKGPKDCLYPHPSDCSRFVQCNEERIAYDMPCAPGDLEWDDATKECTYPELANCQRGSQKTLSHEPTILSPPKNGVLRVDFICPLAEIQNGCDDVLGAGCLYASPDSCTSYIQCVDEVAYQVPCEAGGAWGSGTVWDDLVKACVEPKEDNRCTP
ncbi:hypothetical protein BDV33DRAFT_198957 [Aspergillus novoparasiticus]|uniref:Chitin-binding type-2 domain-containing protein n=1 Tax=Aspergillus novoparasiticus TaxID=986946 RepID=A0A5N6F8P4_9EURO|nr:hypothetical protein BDV33DRAFT_198957 [Aspergillus novoparasiticus]